MRKTNFIYLNYRSLGSITAWKLATVLAAIGFFSLSVRWSYIDTSPPAWDQGLYLYQATLLHHTLMENGLFDFLAAIFNFDRGRVPLVPVIAQPAFYFVGPSLDVAVISLNLAWFVLAWALSGITRELAGSHSGDMAGFFAFVLFGLYPLTSFLSHNFLVELPLVAFTCAAIYSIWLLHKTGEKKWAVIGGIFISLGLLSKVTFPAFVLPAFIILFYRNIRTSSCRSTLALFLPAIFLTIIVTGPYYLYNFKQLLGMTIGLSSHSLAQMYGFKGAFDIAAVLQYLRAVFVNPPTLIAILCAVAMLILRLKKPLEKDDNEAVKSQAQTLINVMLLWFIIPFFLATFGTIKDPRYIYPALVPIFVFAGIMISRFSQNNLAIIFVTLASAASLSGYLYTNNLLYENAANHKLGAALAFYRDSRPDSRTWRVNELVSEIAHKLDALQVNKNVIFLGGNRYYHLRLLDYEGLIGGFHLTYAALPYYSNPSMSMDEALKFISDKSPAGILYKSGENWPEFSSRLDSGIVAQLKADPNYEVVDLDVVQPDGSRFTLFINLSKSYVLIESVSDLVGNWKAGDGVANIVSSGAGSLILTTEKGSEGSANIQDGNISVSSWNVFGRLTADHRFIHWSNGFIWEKLPL